MSAKTVGILTGGGDCPGLNAAIRAITKTVIQEYGWSVFGVLDGYEGLIEGRGRELRLEDVSNILPLGGTILGTSNTANPFSPVDVSDKACANIKKWKLDVLFCIGGDGTLSIANSLHKKFPNIIGLPKTIDNDLKCTDQTFGFDTACAFATEALDKLHTTADSHHRVMVMEVMGRYAGWIALEGGVAGGGDVILIPEMPFSFDKVVEAVEKRRKGRKRSSLVVVAEGARPQGEDYTISKLVKNSPDPIRFGGIGKRVADYIQQAAGVESRVTVLGHLQRGGSPSFFDRILATRYGYAAAELAKKGEFGKMTSLRGGSIVSVDIKEAVSGLKLVQEKDIKMALSLGTSFGI